jgi:hypothetical protein
MPEGDMQRRNLSYTTEALRLWFESQPNVYISRNLFIYYEQNKPEKRIASIPLLCLAWIPMTELAITLRGR